MKKLHRLCRRSKRGSIAVPLVTIKVIPIWSTFLNAGMLTIRKGGIMRSVLRLIMVSALTFSALCLRLPTTATAEKPSDRHLVVITEKDDGMPVKVVVGDTLVVRLASNPTTGYEWQTIKLDTDYLQSTGEPIYESPSTRMPGAGGTQVFTFTTLKPGKSSLALAYMRSWETKPIKAFAIIVQIEP
jgi:predicted secreted protein